MNCFFRPFPGALFRFPHRFFPSLLFLFAGTAVFAGSAPRRVLAQDAPAQTAPASGSAIALIINGRAVQNDPPPVLSRGSTLVPLRGVLENLGATVTYLAAEKRIRIQQGARQVELTVDSDVAMVDGRSTPLPAAPRVMEGRTFVPLRFLAELFGYTVNWFPATRTVTISGGIPAFSPEAARRHQTALQAASAVGVTINFHDSPPADIEPLLDAAQRAGVTLIRTRFDWNALEPTRGAEFNWALYDRIVRAARERGLTVVGILGNSAHWASQFSTLPDRSAWRNAPPRDDALEEWQNYVRRVVGRYANDVHAWQIWESPSSSWFRGGAIKFRTVARLAAEATRASDPGALIFLGEPGGVNLNFINDLNRNGVTPGINGLTLYPTSQWQPGALSAPESYLRPLAALRRELLPSTSGVRHLWIAGLSFPDLNAPPPVPAPTAEAPEAKTPAAQVQPAAQTDAAAPRLQPVAASEAVVIEVADEGTVVRNTALDERIFNTEDKEMRQALKERFTAMAQADYLMQSLVLARAAGVEKTFWGNLRDSEAYDSVDPFDPVYGSGLLRLDNTPRPSYKALQNVISLLQDKPYVGRLAFGPDIAALIFDNGKEGVAAVWAIQGEPRLIFNTTGIDPHAPDAVYLRTTVESQLLDSTGRPLTEKGTEGILKLSSRPVWITKTDVDVARAAKNHPAGEPLVVSDEKHQYPAGGVRAVFDETTPEEGLYWRKYADFRGEAQQLTDVNGGTGLRTEISRDIFNPASGKPSIFLDVADDYLFYAGEGRGEPVQVTVTVARPAPSQSQVVTTTAGFNLRYDAPSGQRFTRWQTVDEGEGWATYTFELPDASFGNVDGYDLAINTFGSKRDLVFGSVTVKRLIEPAPTPTSTPTATPTAMPATTPAPASTPAAVSTPEPPTAPTPSAPTPAAPTSTAPTPTHVPPILNSPIPDLPAPPNANG